MLGLRILMICAIGCCLVTAPRKAHAQILDTLRGFQTNEMGWSGSAELRFSVAGGNTDVSALMGAARSQWQGDDHRWRAIAVGTRVTAGGEEIAESTQLHVRHNAHLKGRAYSLAFTQHQHNPFQRLRSRFLLGAGIRIDLIRGEKLGMSLGASHMTEIERIQDESGSDTDQRMSSFVMVTGQLNEHVGVDITGFVQPLWREFGDMRAILNAGLRASLGSGFSLNLVHTLAHDSSPPAGVETTDWRVQSGVSVDF